MYVNSSDIDPVNVGTFVEKWLTWEVQDDI